MAHHILIPTDGSPLADKAVEQGVALARELGAQVTFVTVIQPFGMFSLNPDQVSFTRDEYDMAVLDQVTIYLKEAAARAQAAGVACETTHVEHGHPHEAIIDTALARMCDMIAMSSHGRSGFSAIVLGSVTLKVLTHSTIPVIVYR